MNSYPPSTTMVCPTIICASSVHSHATTRRNLFRRDEAAGRRAAQTLGQDRVLVGKKSSASVSTTPGLTVLHTMP